MRLDVSLYVCLCAQIPRSLHLYMGFCVFVAVHVWLHICVCLYYVCVGVNQTAWFASTEAWSK